MTLHKETSSESGVKGVTHWTQTASLNYQYILADTDKQMIVLTLKPITDKEISN